MHRRELATPRSSAGRQNAPYARRAHTACPTASTKLACQTRFLCPAGSVAPVACPDDKCCPAGTSAPVDCGGATVAEIPTPATVTTAAFNFSASLSMIGKSAQQLSVAQDSAFSPAT